MLLKYVRQAGGREAFTNFSIFGIEKDLGGQDMFDPVNVYQVNLNYSRRLHLVKYPYLTD
jgi:hypothetical protein